MTPVPVELSLPETVTVDWLRRHVSASMWTKAAALLVSAFTLGVAVGQTTFVRELFTGKVEERVASAAASMVIVPGDILIPVSDPTYHSNVQTVTLNAGVTRGTAALTRQASLLRTELDPSYYPPGVARKPIILSVRSSSALIREGGSGDLKVDIDWSALVPPPALISKMRPGSRVVGGQLVLRVIFSDPTGARHTDVPIPIVLAKDAANKVAQPK